MYKSLDSVQHVCMYSTYIPSIHATEDWYGTIVLSVVVHNMYVMMELDAVKDPIYSKQRSRRTLMRFGSDNFTTDRTRFPNPPLELDRVTNANKMTAG